MFHVSGSTASTSPSPSASKLYTPDYFKKVPPGQSRLFTSYCPGLRPSTTSLPSTTSPPPSPPKSLYVPPHKRYGSPKDSTSATSTIEISSSDAGKLIGVGGVEIEKIRDQLPQYATIKISQAGPSIRIVTIVASSSDDVAVVEELIQKRLVA